MPDKKPQPEKGAVTGQSSVQEVKKGHQPVTQTNDTASGGILGGPLRTDAGYQPKGNLDVSNPPKGGSGVPKAPVGDVSSDKKG
jgi:hypothetical protein